MGDKQTRSRETHTRVLMAPDPPRLPLSSRSNQVDSGKPRTRGDLQVPPPTIFICWGPSHAHLLIHSNSIQSIIHDVHPAILGGQDKEGHQSLETKEEGWGKRCGLIRPPLFCL